MKTFLKVIGWLSVGVAVLGGPRVMIHQNFAWPSVLAELFWIVLAWICFSKAKKNKRVEE